MPTFTVKEVLSARPWPAEPEPAKVIYYDFRAEEVEKVCNIGRKPGNDLKPGDRFEASAVEDRGKLKLKTEHTGNRGGGGPRPEDPKRQAIILRQHSQSQAVQTLALAERLGIIDTPKNGQALMDMILKLADIFDRDAMRAREAA